MINSIEGDKMINSREPKELHPCLQRGLAELLRRSEKQGLQVLVTQTYRDAEYQDDLYAQGRTRPGQIVTNAKGGQSMHNYRYAFDICKNVKGQEYSDSNFFSQIGKIWTDMGGEWGGNWTSFVDKPHFQFTTNLSDNDVIKGKRISDNAKMKWEENQSEGADEVIEYKKVIVNGISKNADMIVKNDDKGNAMNFIRVSHLRDITDGKIQVCNEGSIPILIM
jgi:hypothetical protein